MAWARSFPDAVVRKAAWRVGERLALRKAVRRFVSRRGGVGVLRDMVSWSGSQ